jgi:predicted Zn-dependent protease
VLKRIFILVAVVASTFGFTSIGTSCTQHVFEKTDTQAEIDWGRGYYDSFLNSNVLSRNESYKRRVQRLLDQLQQAMATRPYPFQAVVIADNIVNAGCFPGGYMIVYEGLVVKMPDDNQLAFTLAHEIGHAVRRHWAREMRVRQTDTFIDLLGVLGTNGAYTAPDRTLGYLKYGRDLEDEADAFGTELYLRAGFPPERVGDGMAVLASLDKGQREPEYLRSHPYSVNRLKKFLT